MRHSAETPLRYTWWFARGGFQAERAHEEAGKNRLDAKNN
jgi:hypothetical protein